MTEFAIVGIGCRFPGDVSDTDSYWSLLMDRRSAIGEIPPERWSIEGFYDPRPDIADRSYSKWGGFLSDIRSFDPSFFGLTRRDAEVMDPQQRLLVQVAYEALCDAGIPITTAAGARAGVFIGVSNIDYGLMQRFRPRLGEIQAGTGTALSIVANRLSNALNLTGPSMGIDTACSSALVALDSACRNLADGRCDLAIAGGVNILLDPRMFITFCRAHMLSPTGRIAAFDAQANGFVRGEGVGAIILKRLEDAKASGDEIYAVIAGTSVNQDGATGTITAPNPAAQAAMLRDLRTRHDLSHEDLAYVEAHGTGTELGDPIEANAVGEIFGGSRRGGRPLYIGSVKTQIGHLEPAAGIAGLIKAALVLHKRVIAPSANFHSPNPRIKFAEYGLKVPSEPVPIDDAATSLHAIVNSFGFGGTNAAALLRSSDRDGEANWNDERTTGPGIASISSDAQRDRTCSLPFVHAAPLVPVPLSAPTRDHLKRFAHQIRAALVGAPKSREFAWLESAAPAELAAAIAQGRDHFPCRAVILAANREDLLAKLDAVANGREWPMAERAAAPEIIYGAGENSDKFDDRICFTFTGQGGQWWAMGRDFLNHHPVFQDFIDRFDAIFGPLSGWSVRDVLSMAQEETIVHDPAITPAVMFALQAGLVEVWRQAGITPAMTIGHSFGEVTAAYVAGAIALEDVAHLVKHRGLIRGHIERVGGMAAIGLGATEIEQFLPPDGSIEIGGYNSPTMVTVSGEAAAIDRLVERLQDYDPDILAKRLDLDFAWHSSWLAPGEKIFKDDVGAQPWREPDIPVISTVTGKREVQFDTDYWWRNLRYPVRYQAAIETALGEGIGTFIEFGPHRTLSSMTQACAAGMGHRCVAVTTLHRKQNNFTSLSAALGELYVAGHALDWSGLFGKARAVRRLPGPPWINQEMWHETGEARASYRPEAVHSLLGQTMSTPEPSWQNHITLQRHAYLSDHRVAGGCLFPAAAYIEIFRAAAVQILGDIPLELTRVRFSKALPLGADDEVELLTAFQEDRNRLTVWSRDSIGGGEWQVRAHACVMAYEGRDVANPAAIAARAPIDGGAFYDALSPQGYNYGPQFQGIARIAMVQEKNISRVSAGLTAGEPTALGADRIGLDPRALDSALQCLAAPSLDGAFRAREAGCEAAPVTDTDTDPDIDTDAERATYLPRAIERIVIHDAATPLANVAATIWREGDGRTRLADLDIYGPDGARAIAIEGLAAQALASPNRQPKPTGAHGAFYQERFEPFEPEAETVRVEGGIGADDPRDQWLIVALNDGAARLVQGLEGVRAAICEPGERAPVAARRVSEIIADRAGELRGVILDARACSVNPGGPGNACEAVVDHSWRLIELAREIRRSVSGTGIDLDLWLFTNVDRPGLRAGTASEQARRQALVQIPLLAVARTIAMECPEFNVRLADFAVERPEAYDAIAMILGAPGDQSEFAIDGKRIVCAKLAALYEDDLPAKRVRVRDLEKSSNYAFSAIRGAGIEALGWRLIDGDEESEHGHEEDSAKDVREDIAKDIKVEVSAVGLNFRDVMAATSMLPSDAEQDDPVGALGLEFAGRVGDVPEGSPIEAGSRIFAMARGALKRIIEVPAGTIHKIPEILSDEEAASFPSAYLTAHYSLNQLARMGKGETVLIHAGTGGVGLAAIALAKRAGAKIIASAGSDAKRAYLRELGVDCVVDSRSLSFADDAMKFTNGAGVDILLNALPADYIKKGLECLAPYGRFVELGKRDIYRDSSIGLLALRRNISLHVVDLAAMLVDRPELIRQMMDDLIEMLEAGEISPLPLEVFSASHARDAFHHFAKAKHIGKIVISMDDSALEVEDNIAGGLNLSSRASYLISGGTSGFGLATASLLARSGAGRIVLASRSADECRLAASAIDRIESIRKSGVEVSLLKLDVTDAASVGSAIAGLASADLPLRGIVHAGVIYDDALLDDMTEEKVRKVVGPKVGGAVNLTQACLHHGVALDFFLSISSLAQLLGWSGQSNYTAANAFLEAFALEQRSLGICGQTIHLGALAESGFVARNQAMTSYLTSAGMIALADEPVLAALAAGLQSSAPVLTFAAADWEMLATTQPALARSERIADLRRAGGDISGASFAQSLTRTGPQAALAIACRLARESVSQVLRIDPEDVTLSGSLAQIGLDSLSTFELRNRLETQAGISLPLGQFVQANSVQEIAEIMVSCAIASGKADAVGGTELPADNFTPAAQDAAE